MLGDELVGEVAPGIELAGERRDTQVRVPVAGPLDVARD